MKKINFKEIIIFIFLALFVLFFIIEIVGGSIAAVLTPIKAQLIR